MRSSSLIAVLTAGVLLFAVELALGAETGVVAFENVNVIPMDRERVIERQIVVVKGGRIVQLGAARSVKIPADALRVNGAGKYLMPGMAEMHGHLPALGSTPEAAESWFFLYVANGVTTVRGMLGNPLNLEQKASIAAGRLLGP